MNVGFVTDSTSDIPWDFAKKNNIKVVSLYVMINDKEVKEDENFNREEYYKLFEEEKAFLHIPKLQIVSFVPKTSQPNPRDFEEAYKRLIDEGIKEIVTVCVTTGLSGTINSAHLASKSILRKNKEVKIFIIDSKSASYPEVVLLRLGLKLREKGYTGEQIANILSTQALKIKTVIFLTTLRYLWKGGRLKTSKFILGTLLRKKPIVTTDEDGHVIPAGSASDIEGGLKKTLEISLKGRKREPKGFSVVYGSRKDFAEKLRDLIKSKYPDIFIELVPSRGSVLSHLGPESIGLITDYTDDEF
ncbi:MAG: DegV family protein [Candidatus Heimdallarchaeaceae archaeon]